MNVGSVASFYAGASANTGQSAKISFGSDGRIRGAGAYVREKFGEEVEFLIAGTTTFGGGEDGDLMIQSNGSGGQLKVWKDGNGSSTPGQTINSGVAAKIASVNYADTMIRKLATAGNVVELARDVYLRVVIFDVTQGDLYVNTNGFRFFASEGIFIYGTAVGDNKVVIRNNGGDGVGGSNGNPGSGSRANNSQGFPAAAGGTGGAGGAAGAPGAGGTLAAPASGSAGGAGGQGADIKSGGSTGTGTPGVGTSASTPSAAQDGLSNSLPNISPLSPVGGAAGGAGGADSSGTAAAGAGSGGSAVSNVQAGIQWLSTPVDSIIKFRAEFGTNDYPVRLVPSPPNVGGSGGSGGGGATESESGMTATAQDLSSFAGGGGGGGGGAGGNGGSVLVCSKIIDFWKSTSTYIRQANVMNIYNPGSNSQYGDLKIQADGGNGGRGGTGGEGGDNLI